MNNLLKLMLMSSALLYMQTAAAFNTKPVPEECKNPKFEKFSLPTYKAPERIEVPPESEFSFVLSSKINPETIKVVIKDKEIPYTVENKKSFYRITSKIPAEYTGQFVRISTFVTALLDCKGKDGWLVKVADAQKEEPKAEEESKKAEEKAAPEKTATETKTGE